MSHNLSSSDAINAALKQDWPEAIRINTILLKEDAENIDAMNRLAFAHSKTGDIDKAKKFYKKVLSLDQYNQIATKNIQKLDTVKNGKTTDTSEKTTTLSPLMFLEEPGKTKIVTCINPAPSKVLSVVSSGQEVFLKAKKHCVEIRDAAGTYLGALPDDMSYKLIKYMEGGNQYAAVVKSVAKNSLLVLLREVSRGKQFAHQPSFISAANYMPYTKSDDPSAENTDTTEAAAEEEV